MSYASLWGWVLCLTKAKRGWISCLRNSQKVWSKRWYIPEACNQQGNAFWMQSRTEQHRYVIHSVINRCTTSHVFYSHAKIFRQSGGHCSAWRNHGTLALSFCVCLKLHRNEAGRPNISFFELQRHRKMAAISGSYSPAWQVFKLNHGLFFKTGTLDSDPTLTLYTWSNPGTRYLLKHSVFRTFGDIWVSRSKFLPTCRAEHPMVFNDISTEVFEQPIFFVPVFLSFFFFLKNKSNFRLVKV